MCLMSSAHSAFSDAGNISAFIDYLNNIYEIENRNRVSIEIYRRTRLEV